jgi:hypothetical protein
MDRVETIAPPAAKPNVRPGLILAAVILALYGGLALAVDFPRAAIGIQGDEATYYMMAYSFALDHDVTYRREDLVRVWREFPAGPTGLFLKRGQDVKGLSLTWRPPFVTIRGDRDPDETRLFYAKSFIYPLVAAPFVWGFGTNGFLLLHALLLAAATLAAYLFLHARSPAAVAALFASGFAMASVVPVYFVWIAPELFNFCLTVIAYFCWLYKEVARADAAPRGTGWLFGPKSDVAAAGILGLLTFSKPTNALLFLPLAIWWIGRRRFRQAARASIFFAAIAIGLFAINVAVSGDWNYQGGDRGTCYFEFPFQTPASGLAACQPHSRGEVLGDIIFNSRTFASNLIHNVEYFFVGRHAGLLAYYFPAFFAIVMMLATPRGRPGWQWLVLASGLAQGLIFVIATPYTWTGGGVGNRYFASGYGVMVFLLPATGSIVAALVPWAVGGLFVAPMVLNPFVASFRPADNAKSGPLRLLPVELTLVNDLPVNTDPEHHRIWFGDNPGRNDPAFLVYFLDDNAWAEADKSLWTRGAARAEFIIKTDRPMRRITFAVTAGPVASDVTVRIAGRSRSVHLEPGQSSSLTMPMPPGVPYEKEVHALAWLASVSCSSGFTPVLVEPQSTDTRYLGVRVKPTLVE